VNETQVGLIVTVVQVVLWVWLMVGLQREGRRQRRFLEDLLRYLKEHGWGSPQP
jgi:hypothetical protein